MRTTLNLPDALAADVKARALREGRTMTSFIEEALRDHLAKLETERAHEPLPTFTPVVPGSLLNLDDKDALRRVLDERA